MSEKILFSLGMISDEMVDEAMASKVKNNVVAIRRNVAVAASLTLVIGAVVISLITNGLHSTTREIDNSTQVASIEGYIDAGEAPLFVYYEGKYYFFRGHLDNSLPEGYEYVGQANNIHGVMAENNFDSNKDGRIYINKDIPDSIYFRWNEWDEEAEGKPEPFLILKPDEE